MFYKILKEIRDKSAFSALKFLSAFPSLMRLIYPYRDVAYRILFPARRCQNYFFDNFSKGKYKNTHVALIQAPGWGVNTPPLGIASLAVYLRRYNFKVMLVDINVDMYRRNVLKYKEGWLVDVNDFWTNSTIVENFISDNKAILDKYVDCIIQSGSKVIGFTIYSSSLTMSCYLAKEIKLKAQDRVIVFGGPQASIFMSGNSIIENNPDVDFVVQGEGEETLLEIVQKVFSGTEITECEGVIYRRNGKVFIGHERELIKKLDSLPFPDFSDFNFSMYKEPFKIPISSSRGCVNRCIFCNERPYAKGLRYRSRSGDSMYEEVKYQLNRHHGVFFLEFQDSLVNGNIKALERFCNLIIENNVKIQWAGQAVIRKEMTYELLVKLKETGCVSLSYGLETTSSTVLEKVGKILSKGVDIDQIVENSYRAGVGCVLNFMFGLPGETEVEAEENIKFLKKNAGKIRAINPSPYFCIICPGTLAYDSPGEFGIDLSKGTDYWESIDGNNNYLKRMERFEKFIATAHELGIPSTYSHSEFVKKSEALANYYFAAGEYEKAIPYYENILKETKNQIYRDNLNICYNRSKNKSLCTR